MSVTFRKGATSVTVQGYNYPFSDSFDTGQVEAITQGGRSYVQTKRAQSERKLLQWSGMPTTEKDALKSFLRDTVNGMSDLFEFDDVDGVTHNVKWKDPIFSFQSAEPGQWAGWLTLEFLT